MFALNVIFVFLFSVSGSIKYNPSFNFKENWFANIPEKQFQFGEPTEKNNSIYRLPNTVKPLGYDLRICPFLEGDFIFAGEVYIRVFSEEYTKIVKLHSYGLKITGAYLRTRIKVWSPIDYSLDSQNQLLILNLKSYFLRPNDIHDLHISFAGQLNDYMQGFYRSSYRVGNKTEWLAITQFESTFARSAFPCFDEPHFKANFSISIARYKNQVAISNMPLEHTSNPDPSINNRVWDTFEITNRMSTYLVAFMVSKYTSTSNSDDVTVWARETAIQDGNYAYNIGEKVLDEMEKFTDIEYSLPKMDMAAIPDFNAGAMENWGFTTYREKYLLYNKKLSTERNKENVMTIIAHELAHQWFGDYVTPIWWDYLWLKEGFATYFEYHIPNEVEPTWKMKDFFVPEIHQYALYNDGVSAYHPLNSKVQSPDDIHDIYDVISYQKGACIIRMLEHIVSPSTFKKGLNTFLRMGHAMDGLVTPDILWNAFDTHVKQDSVYLPEQHNISSVMKGWTENVGYPLITVRRERKGMGIIDVVITQTNYRTSRSPISSSDNQWIVPITYTTKRKMNFNDTRQSIWSFSHKDIILVNQFDVDDWVILNIQQTGYYRVNYDRENWNLLIKQLKEKPNVIHHLNRAQLIDDSIYLAIDEKLPFAITFDLLNYLENETDTIPWFSAIYKLNSMYTQFEATSIGIELKIYVLRLISHIYKRVGFVTNENDPHLTKTFRSLMVSTACNLDHPDCVEQAKKEYKKNEHDISAIESNVKNAVFCTVLKTNDCEILWNKMWTLYNNSNVANEKEIILNSLGCTNNQVLLKKYLTKVMDDNDKEIRPQDENLVFRSIFSSKDGITCGLRFIEDIMLKLSKLSKNAYRKVMTILNYLKWKIKTQIHVLYLNKLVSKSEELNQEKHANFVNTLKDVQVTAAKRIAYNNGKSEQISAGLQGIILEPNKPSSASYLIPMTLSCLLFICAIPVTIYRRLLM